MTSVLLFMTAVAIGLLTAGIAMWKGREPWQWLLFGTVLCIVAIPLLLIKEQRPSGRSRYAWIFFLAALMIITAAGVLFVNRLQNAGTL
ncbi:MAG: hypothetical protein JWM58_3289 [Rhizobium sp.]|nr:hypothetical protein [Rhizobium sp.]